MIATLANLLKILASETENWQLAMAVVCGFALAFLPLMSLQTVVVLLLVCFLRVNIGLLLIVLPPCLLLSWVLSGPMVSLGAFLLNAPSYAEFWTALYQQDWFRLARLNHTLVLGATAVVLVLMVPLYLFALVCVSQYRTHVLAWVNQLKVAKLLRGTELFQRFLAIKD